MAGRSLFLLRIWQDLFTLPHLLSADVGGARCFRMDVELAGWERSAKCPKHSTEAHQQSEPELGKSKNKLFKPVRTEREPLVMRST